MTEKKQKKENPEIAPKPQQNVQVGNNTVLVGQKPVMNYVIACLTHFNSGAQHVVVKARGRAITKAVDTVELLRRAFVKNLQLQGVDIRTEGVTRQEGQTANVSAIEITVTRS